MFYYFSANCMLEFQKSVPMPEIQALLIGIAMRHRKHQGIFLVAADNFQL